MKKTFEKCMWEDLTIWFGLERAKKLESLSALIEVKVSKLDEMIDKQVRRLHELFLDNFWNWNEDELKMQFISPILFLIDFNDAEKYHPFSQRPLKMKIDNVELSGIVEWMLASGKQTPREPFFFLHEYKKEQGTDADPLGQLLAAMIVAQHQNKDPNKVLYGCYIVGKDWYFIVLDGKKFQTTLNYNVTELDKLYTVFAILNNIKTLI